MFEKTNGTNEKVVPQGFILASANERILFHVLTPKNKLCLNIIAEFY